MHQHRHQATRIDAEKPWAEILVSTQIDEMRRPRDAFEIEEDAKLLRARRAGIVQHMHTLPPEHLAGPNVSVDQLNHVCLPPALSLPSRRRTSAARVWAASSGRRTFQAR